MVSSTGDFLYQDLEAASLRQANDGRFLLLLLLFMIQAQLAICVISPDEYFCEFVDRVRDLVIGGYITLA